MAVTIDDIKNLRNRTCCGISDCKKALIEAAKKAITDEDRAMLCKR